MTLGSCVCSSCATSRWKSYPHRCIEAGRQIISELQRASNVSDSHILALSFHMNRSIRELYRSLPKKPCLHPTSSPSLLSAALKGNLTIHMVDLVVLRSSPAQPRLYTFWHGMLLLGLGQVMIHRISAYQKKKGKKLGIWQ